MKRSLIILKLLISAHAFACGGAYQLRLFPIGTTDDGIIIIESSLNRYWGEDTVGATEETRDHWRGFITLKSYDKAGKFKTLDTIDEVDFLDRDYVKKLNVSFTKGLAFATEIKSFKKINSPVNELCNVRMDCYSYQVANRSDRGFSLKLNNKDVPVKPSDLVVEEANSNGGLSSLKIKLLSVREIKCGERSLTILTFITAPDEIETYKISPVSTRNKSDVATVYPDFVQYHGLNFDELILN